MIKSQEIEFIDYHKLQEEGSYLYQCIQKKAPLYSTGIPFHQFENNETPLIEVIPEEEKEKEEFVIHKIQPSDSLMSLSIKYDVSIAKLKSYNSLETSEIYFLKEIKIPGNGSKDFLLN